MTDVAGKHLLMQVFFLLLFAIFYSLVAWPGLHGGFVLDDWPNLDGLEKVKDSGDIWRYSLTGGASYLGRPLSYLSFALQASDWPNEPFSFKLVNLIIHCVNAILLWLISRQLSDILNYPSEKKFWISILVPIVWLFLPIHASTVFYVVQRMTLLSGFYTLLGVFGFVYGYNLSANYQRNWLGVLIASVGAVIGYLGGVLSKENGVLLCVFIFLLYRLARPRSYIERVNVGAKAQFSTMFGIENLKNQHRYWSFWILFFSVLPVFLLAIYFLWGGRFLESYQYRDFELKERIMSELVILWDYVIKIFFPTPSGLNFYNDGFSVFRKFIGLPLLALIAWAVVIFTAWRIKNLFPCFLFGLLWYLGGHLLESSFLGLELYFEHRNYIPSIGLVFATTAFVVEMASKNFPVNNKIIDKEVFFSDLFKRNFYLIFFVSIAILLYAAVLRIEAISWSSDKHFMMAGLNDRPDSLRARQEAVSYYVNSQDFKMASGILHSIDLAWPNRAGTLVGKILLHCMDSNVVIPGDQELRSKLVEGKYDRSIGSNLFEVYSIKRQGGCKDLSWADYRNIVGDVSGNPSAMISFQKNAATLIAYSYNAEENYAAAAAALNALDESRADIDFLILKAKFQAMSDQDVEALSTLSRLRDRFSNKPLIWLSYKKIIERLESLIEEKISR